ncbi:hypothetical protein [Geomicrobium sp. JCM 19039]|nr:hypothetical protein [Geomicrobium sp. JCM 19039]
MLSCLRKLVEPHLLILKLNRVDSFYIGFVHADDKRNLEERATSNG